jgi:hypothetical protein
VRQRSGAPCWLAPFRFPGDFARYEKLDAEIGLHEYGRA